MSQFRDIFGDPADPRRMEKALNMMFAAIEEAGGSVGSEAVSFAPPFNPEYSPPTHNHPFEIISRNDKQKVLIGHVAWNEGTSSVDSYAANKGIVQRDVVCPETDFQTVTGEKAWWLKMNYEIGRQSWTEQIDLNDHVDPTNFTQYHRLEMFRVTNVTFNAMVLDTRTAFTHHNDDEDDFENGIWYKKIADVKTVDGNAFVDAPGTYPKGTQYVRENLVFPELVDGVLITRAP